MRATHATLFAKHAFTTAAWLTNHHQIITKDITPQGIDAIYHVEIQIPIGEGDISIRIQKITEQHQETVAQRTETYGTPQADEAIAAVIYITTNIGQQLLLNA